MMKIQNSDFYEILPDSFKNTETRCVAYALSKAMQRLCEAARDVCVMAGIDGLSENILDYLAVELRAPYCKPGSAGTPGLTCPKWKTKPRTIAMKIVQPIALRRHCPGQNLTFGASGLQP